MTVQEAIKNRIPRIRRSYWASQKCYLRLPLLKNGLSGPWIELYDEDIQKDVLNVIPGSQKVLAFQAGSETDYEAYTGLISEYENHEENFAKSYVEE